MPETEEDVKASVEEGQAKEDVSEAVEEGSEKETKNMNVAPDTDDVALDVKTDLKEVGSDLITGTSTELKIDEEIVIIPNESIETQKMQKEFVDESSLSEKIETKKENVLEADLEAEKIETENEMQAQKIEPSSPPMTNRQQAGKSWSELSQLESETVKEREEKEGSWGKSWGEVRSNVEDSANLNPARTQEEVEEKGDKVEVEEKEEERLEPERTMEGLSESSEDSNSLQAFRAVEKK